MGLPRPSVSLDAVLTPSNATEPACSVDDESDVLAADTSSGPGQREACDRRQGSGDPKGGHAAQCQMWKRAIDSRRSSASELSDAAACAASRDPLAVCSETPTTSFMAEATSADAVCCC